MNRIEMTTIQKTDGDCRVIVDDAAVHARAGAGMFIKLSAGGWLHGTSSTKGHNHEAQRCVRCTARTHASALYRGLPRPTPHVTSKQR